MKGGENKMYLKNKKFLIIFLIILIINLTPAFATKIDQVANEAQDYNTESQKKMGFFKKIGFMVKGYKLIKEAKSAKDDIDNEDQVKSTGDKYEDMWNSNQLSLKERKALLAFRNSNKTKTVEHENNEKIPSNNTNYETLPTNNITSTNNTYNVTTVNEKKPTFIIPEICHTDAEKLIQELQKQGITTEKHIQYEITHSLKNKIVQIIDKNGDIRYVYVKNIDLKNLNSTVSLITNENKTIVLSLDEFKKAYTGIVLSTESTLIPETIMNIIIGIQKSNIEIEQNKTQSLKDRAIRDALGWGIGGIGGGILLLIVGIIIAVYFWSQVVKAVNEQAARSGQYVARVNDPALWAKDKGAYPAEYYNDEFALNEARSVFRDSFAVGVPFANIMAIFATMGITVIFQATGETVLNALSQNWIKVILGIIGIILIIAALVLIGFSIYYLIKSVHRIIDSNLVLKSLDARMEKLDEWINKDNPITDLPLNKNNITGDNQTVQNMTADIQNA